MKKVFHFVKTNILSGLEKVVINIGTLVDGYEHYYVSPSGPIDKFLREKKIPHIVVDTISIKNVREVILKYRPDIVQGHDVTASVCLAANFFYCKRNDIKMVSHIHNNDLRMTKPSLRALIYLISALTFDNIIFVSKTALDEYYFCNLIRTKSTVITNVINENQIQEKQNANNYSKNWDLIFLGRLSEQKQPEMFIDVVKKISEKQRISAVMVGQGELEDELKNKIFEDNLEKTISLTGFQPNPYKYLVRSKVLLMPSAYEGFPMVALEALLLGVPVVGTPVSGLIDIVNERCGGLGTTVSDLSAKVMSIINDSNYQRWVVNAKNRGEIVNNTEKFVSSLKEIYG